jgi:hypothetical protein
MSREIYGPAGPHMNLFLFLVIYKEEYIYIYIYIYIRYLIINVRKLEKNKIITSFDYK